MLGNRLSTIPTHRHGYGTHAPTRSSGAVSGMMTVAARPTLLAAKEKERPKLPADMVTTAARDFPGTAAAARVCNLCTTPRILKDPTIAERGPGGRGW